MDEGVEASFTLLGAGFSVRVPAYAKAPARHAVAQRAEAARSVQGSSSGSGSMLIQQEPIIVGVVDQPEAARDISLDVVLGMFSMAGVLLLFAALGGLVVGAIFIAIRRARDAKTPSTESDHIRLGSDRGGRSPRFGDFGAPVVRVAGFAVLFRSVKRRLASADTRTT